ncbi:MAG: tetratricopeptide repeat protein [Anaerolineae bacterium]|nr:tetratricopeptide repeat protein [Anaerolineae bacterium]
MRAKKIVLLLPILPLALLLSCTYPTPDAPRLRLPTRAPSPTPSPTSTPTPTPVYVSPLNYYIDGLVRQSAGDPRGALQSFTWAIAQRPDFVLAYVKRGSVYLSLGKLNQALADADAALKLNSAEPSAWLLRGETLRLLGRPRRALEAFDRALALDPTLRPDIFRSRWLAALEAHDVKRLVTLSQEFVFHNPDDPMRYYYRGWALIQSGESGTAVRYLVRGIEKTPDPPALLWFTLGHAYAAEEAWREAVTSFETTRLLVERGDSTLALHSERPIIELFGALGRAYLGARRCADAEAMLEYAVLIGASPHEYASPLEEARLCQTPTPTPTAYPTLRFTQ